MRSAPTRRELLAVQACCPARVLLEGMLWLLRHSVQEVLVTSHQPLYRESHAFHNCDTVEDARPTACWLAAKTAALQGVHQSWAHELWQRGECGKIASSLRAATAIARSGARSECSRWTTRLAALHCGSTKTACARPCRI